MLAGKEPHTNISYSIRGFTRMRFVYIYFLRIVQFQLNIFYCDIDKMKTIVKDRIKL